MSVSRKLATAICLGSLVVAVAACGGGGSSSGGSGGGSSSSSSSAASVTSYAAGSVMTVASAYAAEDISVTGLSDGNYLIAWSGIDVTSDEKDSEGSGVYYRIYRPSGATVTAVRVANTTRANDQRQPAVVALKGGGFVMVWSDSSTGKIYMQRFDNGGGKQGSQTQISTTSGDGAHGPRAIPMANGGYLVTWTEFHPSGGVGPARTTVKAGLFTASGAASGAGFQLADISDEGGAMYNDRVVPLANGNFVFLLSTNYPRTGSSIWPNLTAQVYTSSGVAQGAAYYVNDISNGAGFPSAIPTVDGGYLAMWLRTSYGVDIRTRRIDAAGAFAGSEAVYDTTGTVIAHPRLAPLANGKYVVAWNGYSNVSGQVFNADGTAFNARFDAMTGSAAVPDDLALGSSTDDSFAVSWFDGPGQLYRNLSLRIYAPRS